MAIQGLNILSPEFPQNSRDRISSTQIPRIGVIRVLVPFWFAHDLWEFGGHLMGVRGTPYEIANKFDKAKKLRHYFHNLSRLDGQVRVELENLGWQVVTVWECELRDRAGMAARLVGVLERCRGRYEIENWE